MIQNCVLLTKNFQDSWNILLHMYMYTRQFIVMGKYGQVFTKNADSYEADLS